MTTTDPLLTRLDTVDEATLDHLHALGEHLAAGFLELHGATPLERMSRALRRQWEQAALPAWQGEPLYPAGRYSWYASDQPTAVGWSYSHSLTIRQDLLDQRSGQKDAAGATFARLRDLMGNYPQVGTPIDTDLRLGGANYTHAILNYGRIVREGLATYGQRVQARLERTTARGAEEKRRFYMALADTLTGLRVAHRRALAALEQAEPGDPAAHTVWQRLVSALEWVPWHPARDFYEALVVTNFCCYVDGVDSLGRFDQDLGPLYEADLDAGRVSEAEGVAWVGLLWDNIDANSGWNVAIGGDRADGTTACNPLTLACLRAARGYRRPNLALRISAQTPTPILEAALDALSSGCGIPALYNEPLYLRALREARLNIAPYDLPLYAFGGCTETMVHGCSNVGSLDGGLNLPLILSGTLSEHLTTALDFEALWQAFAADLRANIARVMVQVSAAQELHGRYQPQPLRTLLIDDCIDAGIEYNAGGARYNWSVINVAGLANVADSLAAVRELVFEGDLPAPTLAQALAADFQGHEALRQRASRCPRYGNDIPAVDALAQRVARLTFEELRRYAPWRGGRFLPSCLMFITYVGAGQPVPATPDGRHAGEPIADSIGAVAGRDHSGPTALFRSVSSLPQELAPGTLVTNLRLAASMFTGENRTKLIDMVRTYFELGGLQLQLTVVDQDTLRRAMIDPESYGDLIVRVGGYSEYWRNLSDALRKTVLERTEHLAQTP